MFLFSKDRAGTKKKIITLKKKGKKEAKDKKNRAGVLRAKVQPKEKGKKISGFPKLKRMKNDRKQKK